MEVPVDRGYDTALRERCCRLVLPEAVVRSMSFVGLVERVVECCDNQYDV